MREDRGLLDEWKVGWSGERSWMSCGGGRVGKMGGDRK